MHKLRLRFPEGFTVHATALLNHIHSKQKPARSTSFESRLRLLMSVNPLTTANAEKGIVDRTRDFVVK